MGAAANVDVAILVVQRAPTSSPRARIRSCTYCLGCPGTRENARLMSMNPAAAHERPEVGELSGGACAEEQHEPAAFALRDAPAPPLRHRAHRRRPVPVQIMSRLVPG